MSYATIAGHQIHEAVVVFPRVGRWHVEATCDATEDLAGPVEVTIGDTVTLRGTVDRGTVDNDTMRVRVVGGGGGLSKALPAVSYARPVPMSVPLADVLREASETLDGASSGTATTLPRWERPAASAGACLSALLGALVWRLTDAGLVWVGTDAWTSVDAPVELHRDTARRTATYGEEAIGLRPGVSIDGEPVHEVRIEIAPERVRVHARFGGDTWGLFQTLVKRAAPDVDPYALWPATVVAQSADLSTVDVRADSPKLASAGLSVVPLRLGVPGIQVKVAANARVLIGFEGGDRTRPVATLWDATSVQEITVTSTSKVVVVSPDVRLGSAAASDGVVTLSKLTAFWDLLKAWCTSHTHSGVTTGGGVSGVAAATLPPITAIAASASASVRATT
jgi:hypothetical protein